CLLIRQRILRTDLRRYKRAFRAMRAYQDAEEAPVEMSPLDEEEGGLRYVVYRAGEHPSLYGLSTAERRALWLYLGLDGGPNRGFREIAKDLKTSREHARQLVQSGTRKLRRDAEDDF